MYAFWSLCPSSAISGYMLLVLLVFLSKPAMELMAQDVTESNLNSTVILETQPHNDSTSKTVTEKWVSYNYRNDSMQETTTAMPSSDNETEIAEKKMSAVNNTEKVRDNETREQLRIADMARNKSLSNNSTVAMPTTPSMMPSKVINDTSDTNKTIKIPVIKNTTNFVTHGQELTTSTTKKNNNLNAPPTRYKDHMGPIFRPPAAISKHYKIPREDFDHHCWPACTNYTQHTTNEGGAIRKRKHSSEKKKKFHNYKMLYDSLKDQDVKKKETEFYAWIFGATMLSLGTLTAMTSCFVFCLCGKKVKRKRKRSKYDKSGSYQRVDSVSSMVSNQSQFDISEALDSVTII